MAILVKDLETTRKLTVTTTVEREFGSVTNTTKLTYIGENNALVGFGDIHSALINALPKVGVGVRLSSSVDGYIVRINTRKQVGDTLHELILLLDFHEHTGAWTQSAPYEMGVAINEYAQAVGLDPNLARLFKLHGKQYKIANVLRLLYFLVGDTCTDETIKQFINATTPKVYHFYATQEHYAHLVTGVHKRTDTKSCMTAHTGLKGANKYNTFVEHTSPMDCYEGIDTNYLLLASPYNPDKLDGETFEEDEYPFINRAIARVAPLRAGDSLCAVRAYGDENASCLRVVDRTGGTGGMQIRLIQDTDGDWIMPYVDGYSQIVGTNYEEVDDEHGRYCVLAEVMYSDDECEGYEDYYAPQYSTGIGYLYTPTYTCAVSGHDVDVDDAVYAEDLDDWVDREFARWDGNRYILDGLAVLNYFR